MESKDQNPEGRESSPGTGLGGRLTSAREARGLTLANVARNLRLSAATLQALESGRYEDLPEPIYVRGYLRAYGRLLEMDEEALVAEYDRLLDAPEPVLTPATRARRQATARTPYLRGPAVLGVVAVVVLFGSWWYSQLKPDTPAPARTVSSQAEQPASPASAPPATGIDLPNPGAVPVVALRPSLPTHSPLGEAAGEPVAADNPEPPAAETAAATETTAPDASESAGNANTDAEVHRREEEASVEPAVPDLPIAPLASERGRLVRASRAPTGEDVLVIKVNEESWAEVVDANGYQLLYYLLRPGAVHHLQGQAPFRVFLGNAPAVVLSLNQERFDHTPFQRRNSTARFSVAAAH
ncbi:MAG: DUF4115 domain-containing protein [Gammaproteobacteria bacterium]